jgi:hypothetical protein
VLHHLITIDHLENEGRYLLGQEDIKESERQVQRPSWKPRPGSVLHRHVTEALKEDAPKDSLYRRACIEGNSIFPALTIALICNGRNNGTMKARLKKLYSKQAVEEGIEDAAENEVVEDVNRDDGKLKSKLTLEEELRVWPTFFFKVLVKRSMMIIAPEKIQLWRTFQDGEIKKRKIGLIGPYSLENR